MSYVADVGPAKRAGYEGVDTVGQGWGLASLVLGVCLILASGLTHVVCWQYLELSRSFMNDLDTRLGLVVCVVDVLVLLTLGVLATVAGVLGLRESSRLGSHRGIALAGMFAAVSGLLCWLAAAANLMIVAISSLR